MGGFTLPSGGLPSGTNTQVQFNDSGAFGGDSGLTYNKTTDALTGGSLYATTALRNNGVERIVNATKPTTRKDGSALVSGDIWHDTTNLRDAYWNGTYWLSAPIIASSGRLEAVTNAGLPSFTGIPVDNAGLVFIEFFVVSYFNNSTNSTTNYYQINLVTRNHTASGSNVRGSMNANSALGSGRVKTNINTAYTVGTAGGEVSEIAAQNIQVGTPTASTQYVMLVQYRWVY